MTTRAFLFPGQGAQYVGMGKDIRDNFAIARQTFEEADEALHCNLTRLCLDGPEQDLKLTENTQPAILTVSIAVMRVLTSETGMRPLILAGHSLGEYASLITAGALSFADAVRTVRLRGKFMQEAVPVGVGAMAAILGLDREAVESLCNDCADGQVLSPANYNCPGQIVISGHAEAVNRAAAKAKEIGARDAVMLAVSAPFHCSLMKKAAEQLAEALEPVEVSDLKTPVISNVEADYYPSREKVKDLLISQVDHPVRWQESMEK
ncbi:MAG: ACP S-malonyltransferase, partial [Proteobacteria bacterium]|nr:ACP S-malonyltransferase [Pseudomonadota bacterium]